MEYLDDEFLMLSGIQHFAFCRRQWALIHIEQQWEENGLTTGGEIMHKRAHDINLNEKTKDTLTVRALPVCSRELGASGVCDVVEFKKSGNGICLHGHRGYFQICPVEYKRGKPKSTEIDILQLTAQVICLEEMFCTEIKEGFLYYGEIRRREQVIITDDLREQVFNMFREMHQIYNRGYTPGAAKHKGCNACSLKDLCLPALDGKHDVQIYIESRLAEGEE